MLNPKALIASLGLSSAETDVLLAILQGAEGATPIMKQTGLKRPTVYYALQRLMQRGFVTSGGRGRGAPLRADLSALSHGADAFVKTASKMGADLQTWIETLRVAPGNGVEKPSVTFYEGIVAVRRAILETLYTRSKHIDCIAPSKNFFKDLGTDFAREYIAERSARDITTRNLWESSFDKQQYKTHYSKRSVVRILPDAMCGRFQTTLFIYDDKVMYISSRKNAYALLVTSKEHVEFMTCLFDGLWSGSKPVSA